MKKLLHVYISFILIGLAILTSSCGAEKSKIEVEPSDKVVKVKTIKPFQDLSGNIYEFPGVVKSFREAVISSKVLAQVVDVMVREGDSVKQGQPLVKLDDRFLNADKIKLTSEQKLLIAEENKLNAEYKKLEHQINMLFRDQEKYLSQAELAKKRFERIKTLYEKDVVSQDEFDQVKTGLDIANATKEKSQEEYYLLLAQKDTLEAEMQKLQAKLEKNQADMYQNLVNFSYYDIVSLFDGIVVKKYADIGDMATPGAPLFKIEDPNQLYLELNIDENNKHLFQEGAKVQLTLDAYPNAGFMSGVIQEVVNSIDPNTHTFKVKVALPPDPFINSGMYGSVKILLPVQNIVIPQSAILKRGQINGIFVVEKSKNEKDETITRAQFKIVKVGKELHDKAEGYVEILSGINKADVIIKPDSERLQDGDMIEVIN